MFDDTRIHGAGVGIAMPSSLRGAAPIHQYFDQYRLDAFVKRLGRDEPGATTERLPGLRLAKSLAHLGIPFCARII